MIPIHKVTRQIGHSAALALPGFHSFTGCDQVSSFFKKGKKTAWDLWLMYPEFTQAFAVLSQMRCTKESVDAVFPLLNRFTSRLWQNRDDFPCVDSLRMHLFINKGKSFDAMPPGSDALKMHSYRAAYQGGRVWGSTLLPKMNSPSPKDWGWVELPGMWAPKYVTQATISAKLTPLQTCGCRTKCVSGKCTCADLKIQCLQLCKCEGKCYGKPPVIQHDTSDQ